MLKATSCWLHEVKQLLLVNGNRLFKYQMWISYENVKGNHNHLLRPLLIPSI